MGSVFAVACSRQRETYPLQCVLCLQCLMKWLRSLPAAIYPLPAVVDARQCDAFSPNIVIQTWKLRCSLLVYIMAIQSVLGESHPLLSHAAPCSTMQHHAALRFFMQHLANRPGVCCHANRTCSHALAFCVSPACLCPAPPDV